MYLHLAIFCSPNDANGDHNNRYKNSSRTLKLQI